MKPHKQAKVDIVCMFNIFEYVCCKDSRGNKSSNEVEGAVAKLQMEATLKMEKTQANVKFNTFLFMQSQ